jgi:hypothetical protein
MELGFWGRRLEEVFVPERIKPGRWVMMNGCNQLD